MMLLDLNTREHLTFQNIPLALTEDRAADISGIKIIGQNIPVYQYTGGESTLSFKLDFYSDEESRQDVIRNIRWLQSLTYNETLQKPAANVQLIWGDLYKKEIWIVKSVRADLSLFNRQFGHLPTQAYADIVLAQTVLFTKQDIFL